MAKGISIRGIRTQTYRLGKGLGDVNAILSGKIVQRVARRVVGKYTGKSLRIFD